MECEKKMRMGNVPVTDDKNGEQPTKIGEGDPFEYAACGESFGEPTGNRDASFRKLVSVPGSKIERR